MVELLRIFDQKPELLIIRGLSSFVSVDMFQKMIQLVERLNEAGVTVLYLTNRLEEAISLSFGITVVDKRRIQGTYSPEEIVSDPRSRTVSDASLAQPTLVSTRFCTGSSTKAAADEADISRTR